MESGACLPTVSKGKILPGNPGVPIRYLLRMEVEYLPGNVNNLKISCNFNVEKEIPD